MSLLSILLKHSIPDKWYQRIRTLYYRVLYWNEIGRKFKGEEVVTISHTKGAFKILVSPKNGYVDGRIFIDGKWEPHITSAIAELLNEDSVFVDIGANIGFFSLLSCGIVTAGKVISFEPLPHLVKQLNKSSKLNNVNNIKVYQYACGSDVSTHTLYIDKDNIGASTFVPVGRYGHQVSTEVAVVPGDDILLSEERIDLIKIDVEGYELEALEGLTGTIKKFKPKLLLEFTPAFYTDDRSNHGQKILRYLFA